MSSLFFDSLPPKRHSVGNLLYLHVKANGTKIWEVQYTFAQKRSWLSLGVYPEMSLEEAEKRRDELREMIKRGEHPLDKKREIRKKQLEHLKDKEENTFEKVAERWYLRKKRNVDNKKNADKYWASLNKNILPVVGKRHIKDLAYANREWEAIFFDVAEKLTKEKGKAVTYTPFERLPNHVREIFDQAISEQIIKNNPIPLVKKRLPNHKYKPMARISYEELPLFLQKLDNYNPKNPRIKYAIWMLLYSAQRQISIYNARWQDFDLDKRIWNRQPEKKDEKILKLPLPDQAISILEELREETYQNNPNNLLFPAPHNNSSEWKSISDRTITDAIKSMGFDMTGHGIRGLVSTSLNDELHQDERLVEKQLGHTVKGAEKVYNTAQYFERRKVMIQRWADHLDELKNLTDQDLATNEPVWDEYRKILELLYFEENPNLPSRNYRELAIKTIADCIVRGDKPPTSNELIMKMAKNEHPDFFKEIAPSVNKKIQQAKIRLEKYKKAYPDQDITLTLDFIESLSSMESMEKGYAYLYKEKGIPLIFYTPEQDNHE